MGSSNGDGTTRAGPSHWDAIYRENADEELSWTQSHPDLSLRLVEEFARRTDRILDVGGGSSKLARHLVQEGFSRVAVLDVSSAALERNLASAGSVGKGIEYIPGDVLGGTDLGRVDVWHDRALLHFLIEEPERRRYVERLRAALADGGVVILAAFSLQGPERCSGLPVRRYSEPMFRDLLGPEFEHHRTVLETHRTPWGVEQPFIYTVFTRGKPRPPG
ncbi:MAG TPA: class I SAM-dependent methyltransferase [Thermoplasmata archaeon]|nr:class I SAM-dependent methyltransferase [Thermoplasmata archaeon]